MKNEFKYYKASDVAQYPFIKFPRELMYAQKYSILSCEAKCLYVAMLERQSLSQKNGWTDESGNVYIILSHTDAAEYLHCSRSKLVKVFAELDEKSGAGLIKRKRQGLGKPDIIYLNSVVFAGDTEEADSVTNGNTSVEFYHQEVSTENNSDNNKKTTGCLKIKQPEVSDTDTNYINNNKNKFIKNKFNNPSYHINPYDLIEERKEYTEIIKQNIDYVNFIEDHRKSIVDEIIKAMVNAICSPNDFIRISGEDVPAEEVKRRFLTMNTFHIDYVYDCVMKNKSPVRNVGAFLLTCLYRAADTVGIFQQLRANNTMYNMNKVT